MGAYSGPEINENGLVLSLDGGNLKSFKGGADTNLLYNISNAYGTTDTTYFKTSYGDFQELIPELGYRTVRYCNIFNDYPNSGSCCPRPFGYGGSVLGQSITVSPSTTYTYQIIYKVKSGYTNANYMYRYEYNSGTYVTEGGVHSTNNRTSLGNNWWFAWGQFTTSSTTNNLWLAGMWYYQYNVYDTIYVAGVSLHQGSHIIPAKFMLTPQENRGTTVATGGGWADLTGNGNNGQLVNGVRESADNLGSLVFDGTDDYCTISNASVLNSIGAGDFTVSMWIYRATNPPTGNGEMLYQSSDLNDGFVICVSGTSFRIETRDRQSTNANVPFISGIFTAGVWNNVVLTKSNTTYNGYSQGIYKGGFTSYQDVSTTTGFVDIGRVNWWGPSHWEGNINGVKVYNRALTATEIQQNFNALRGRFGI